MADHPPTLSPSKKPHPIPWTHDETVSLIRAYQHKWYSLKRGPLKASQWDEVAAAAAVAKSGTQCRHKIEKLRKRYRSEKLRPNPASWPYFDLMRHLEIGPLPISVALPVATLNRQPTFDSDDDVDEDFAKRRRIEQPRVSDLKNGKKLGDSDHRDPKSRHYPDFNDDDEEDEDYGGDFAKRRRIERPRVSDLKIGKKLGDSDPKLRHYPDLDEEDGDYGGDFAKRRRIEQARVSDLKNGGKLGNSDHGDPKSRHYPDLDADDDEDYGGDFANRRRIGRPRVSDLKNGRKLGDSGDRDPKLRQYPRFQNGEEEDSDSEEEGEEEDALKGRSEVMLGELALQMRGFAERFMKVERRKMEVMRETERHRMEMENKRMEMILVAQQKTVDMISRAFAASPSPSPSSSPQSEKKLQVGS